MPKFFIAATNIFGGVAYINGKDAEHLSVLRVKQGEKIIICDGNGNDYECRVSSVQSDRAEAEILSVSRSAGEPTVSAAVYAALPKGDKAELIVQKSVELGASQVVFFPSERCVSRPDGLSIVKKTDRWNKIAAEASKQCYRGVIPKVSFAASFEEMVALAAQAQVSMFFWEEEKVRSMKDVLCAASGSIATAAIVTGPEGGFEKREAELAEQAGITPVTLGRRILRCETAPLCALSALMYHTDNLNM